MFTSTAAIFSLTVLFNSASALANADITPAAQLAPRATNPAFVGYISENGGYSNPRTCNYPQTVSTSNGYVQCCSASGPCPFFTACSGNTLLAEGTSVPCYVNTALTCNTAIVLPTVGASDGGSYLACWQTSLGSSAFTVVQDIGSASSAVSGSASTSATASSGNTMGSSTATRTSAPGSSATTSASSAASSTNVGNNMVGEFGLSGIVGGAVAFLAQALL